MSSTKELVRLAFRPLSTRCQCRYASSVPRSTSTQKAGGLAEDLLRSIESQRQRPGAAVRQAPRTGFGSGVNRDADSGRARGRFADIVQPRAQARAAEELQAANRPFTREELERQAARRWQVGDVYAPHDLTGVEISKWKRLTPQVMGRRDAFDQLGIDPMREYKNFSMMAEYVSETGRIKPRRVTGLRPVNQRRIARAIRRAVGLGLMPRTYKHPELLKREMERRRR